APTQAVPPQAPVDPRELPTAWQVEDTPRLVQAREVLRDPIDDLLRRFDEALADGLPADTDAGASAGVVAPEALTPAAADAGDDGSASPSATGSSDDAAASATGGGGAAEAA